MPRYVSYWLVPSLAPRSGLQECIAALAHAYQAPVFVPHVTLYSGESSPDENPLEVIAQSVRNVQPLSLEIQGISCEDAFTKTLFVQFLPSEVLSRVTEGMRRASARPSSYRLDPHLSLLYKNMGSQDKRALASSIRLPMSPVQFDTVWAVAADRVPRTSEDVLAWEVVCVRNLT